MLDEPGILTVPAQTAAVVHITVPRADIRAVMGPGYRELMEVVASQGLAPAGPWFTRHLRMDPELFDFEIGVPLAAPVAPSGRVRPGSLPATRVVRTIYHGPYEGLPAAWGEFDAWIRDRRLPTEAGLWERYLTGPESNPDSSRWRTELTRPLAAPDSG